MADRDKHIIITGASKGFGRDLSRHLAGENTTLHLVARSNMSGLVPELEARGAGVRLWQQDLTQTETLDGLMGAIARELTGGSPGFIGLVNNAGMIEPMGPAGKYDFQKYKKNLEINFLAPLLLSHAFIYQFQESNALKRIIMVSSGAASKPYHGWSHYCSTKAGVEMFVRTVSIEQEKLERPVQIMAFNPGRIGTGMQKIIRGSSPEDFPMVDDFINAWEKGEIGDPDEISGQLARLMLSGHFPSGETLGVRDL
jgi:benzil reductase ((S)-benzoin forming)